MMTVLTRGRRLLAALLLGLPHALSAQLPPLRDSMIIANVTKASPCPAIIPTLWVSWDTALTHSFRCNLLAAATKLIAENPDTSIRNIPSRAFCVKVGPWDFRHDAYGEPDDAFYVAEFLLPDGGVAMLINRMHGDTSLRRATVHQPDLGRTRCSANWDRQELGFVRTKPRPVALANVGKAPNNWFRVDRNGTADPGALDTARIVRVFAAYLMATDAGVPLVPPKSVGYFRIDTTANQWNRLVASAIRARRPELLPVQADSEAYYTSGRSFERFQVVRDTVYVTLKDTYCSKAPTGGYTAGESTIGFYVTRDAEWLRVSPTTSYGIGEGMCAPYKAGARPR